MSTADDHDACYQGVDIVAATRRADIRPMTPSNTVAFDAFYLARYREALHLATLLIWDEERAAEITQDAFVEAFRRWDRVSRFERPDLWLRRVLINRSISVRRRHRSETAAISRLGRAPEPGGADAVDVGAWSLVGQLPTRQAQALALVYGCDLSLDEASAVMKCSVGSVKTHLSRGRAGVAARLKERG